MIKNPCFEADKKGQEKCSVNKRFVCIEEKHVITVFLVVELEQNCSSAPAEKLLRKLVFFNLFKI